MSSTPYGDPKYRFCLNFVKISLVALNARASTGINTEMLKKFKFRWLQNWSFYRKLKIKLLYVNTFCLKVVYYMLESKKKWN